MTTTMLAVVCDAYGQVDQFGDNVVVRNVDVPGDPGEGQVVLKMEWGGFETPELLKLQRMYQDKPDCPWVMGMEGVGFVVKVGAGVTRLQEGSQVVVYPDRPQGCFAEYLLASAEHCHLIPETIDKAKMATSFLPAGTAHYALNCAGMKPGKIVYVVGASAGVGLMAAQMVGLIGGTVIASARSPEKLSFLREIGVKHFLYYGDLTELPLNPEGEGKKALRSAQSDFTDELIGIAKQINPDAEGVDIVIDPVCGNVCAAALRAVRFGGDYSLIGFVGGAPKSFNLVAPLMQNANIRFPLFGPLSFSKPDLAIRMQEYRTNWLANGELDFPVTTYSVSGVHDALQTMADNQVNGRLALDLSELFS